MRADCASSKAELDLITIQGAPRVATITRHPHSPDARD
jgi:hypothetical protein